MQAIILLVFYPHSTVRVETTAVLLSSIVSCYLHDASGQLGFRVYITSGGQKGCCVFRELTDVPLNDRSCPRTYSAAGSAVLLRTWDALCTLGWHKADSKVVSFCLSQACVAGFSESIAFAPCVSVCKQSGLPMDGCLRQVNWSHTR